MDSAVTQNIEDSTATLPVVISHKEAIYLYGLDIIWTRKRAAQTALSLKPTGVTGFEPTLAYKARGLNWALEQPFFMIS